MQKQKLKSEEKKKELPPLPNIKIKIMQKQKLKVKKRKKELPPLNQNIKIKDNSNKKGNTNLKNNEGKLDVQNDKSDSKKINLLKLTNHF